MSRFADDDSLFSVDQDRNAPANPEIIHIDDTGSRVSDMLVEEYAEEIILEENLEQPEQGSVVREEAPW